MQEARGSSPLGSTSDLRLIALDLRRTFRARTAELLGTTEEDVPPLHLTICSGADVPVAAMSGHDWAGDSFRRAVRMASRSSEGTILIDTPVYYIVRHDFATKYLTAVPVKSKGRVVEETIALYELLDVRDSMKEVQEAPGIYIRGLRVLGRADVADELARRTLAHLRARTLSTPTPDRSSLLPAWNGLLASAADYKELLHMFEALAEANVELGAATYSLLIRRAPDAPTEAYWRDVMAKRTRSARDAAPEPHLGLLPSDEVFQETADTGIAPGGSNSAVSLTVQSSDGHVARGAGVIVNRRPLLIITVSHLLAAVQPGSSVSLAVDGTSCRLFRVIRLPGSQADLLSLLVCRGPCPVGKRSVELPQAAIDLPKGQPVLLELQRGGAFSAVRGEVTGATGPASEDSVLLSIDVSEGDSGAPALVKGRLAGVCQAKSGLGATGAGVISPIPQGSLTQLRSVARSLRTQYRALRIGVAICLAGALAVLGWSVWHANHQQPNERAPISVPATTKTTPRPAVVPASSTPTTAVVPTTSTPSPAVVSSPCDPRPTVTAWLDAGATYYSVGEPILLHYRINKQCNVSLTEQIEGAAPIRLLDRVLEPSGDHDFHATAAAPLGARTVRVSATDACGVTVESVVTFRVGRLNMMPVGP
jgi:hypothetical protein